MEQVIAIIIILVVLSSGALTAGVFVWLSYRSGTAATGGAYLQVIFDDGRVKQIPLRPNKVVRIGRDHDNHLVIPNHLVSRHHARIFSREDGWVLEDADSSNGSFVNQQPVGRCVINPGDDVQIGPVHIRLIDPQAQERRMGNQAEPGKAIKTGPLNMQRFGHYAVLRGLGEGGMNKVLLAMDTRNNRSLVALKVPTGKDEYLLQKFVQEGALRLQHPHIARIIDAKKERGCPYIVMEYVEGAPLRKLMNGQPLSVPTALLVIGQVLAALEYAHGRGVIHRDIKPENIMISPRNGVKIIDFGIARILSKVTITRDGLILGTPHYMSYEQAMGDPVNPTSDLYATAIVLYEMITAKVPFSSRTNDFTEIARQHQMALPMPPAHLNTTVPAHVNAAILRALEKDKNRRFQTAGEFAAALGCPNGQPIPPELAALAERMALAVRIDEGQGNAEELPTRYVKSQPQTTRRPSLKVHSGGRPGAYILLKNSQIIGRSDIDPGDLTISRRHFRIYYTDSTCLIADQNSASGTFVNGVRIAQGTSRRLVPGDSIQVGQTILVYEAPA